MRAILFLQNPALFAKLHAIFVLANIDLVEVATTEQVDAALKQEQIDALILDCSLDRAEDLEHCKEILGQTAHSVHIVTPRASVIEELRPYAHGDVAWIPLDEVGPALLAKLLTVKGEMELAAATEAVLRQASHTKTVYLARSTSTGTQDVVWEGLSTMMQRVVGVDVIDGDTNLEVAIQEVGRLRPDGVVVAVGDDSEVLEAAKSLREASPETRLMAFAERPDDRLEVALEWLGAWTYVLWADVTRDSVAHILGTTLVAGLRVASPRVTEETRLETQRQMPPQDEPVALTADERAVLSATVSGLAQHVIAEREHVSERTVRRRLRRVKHKLGTEGEGRGELARAAQDRGIPPEDT